MKNPCGSREEASCGIVKLRVTQTCRRRFAEGSLWETAKSPYAFLESLQKGVLPVPLLWSTRDNEEPLRVTRLTFASKSNNTLFRHFVPYVRGNSVADALAEWREHTASPPFH